MMLNWAVIWDWELGAWCLTIISLLIGYLVQAYWHRQTKRFELVLSKFYPSLKNFIESAMKFKDNVNTLYVKDIIAYNASQLDNMLILPKLEMKNNATILSLFFSKEDRKPFTDILEASDMFTSQISKLLNCEETDIWNGYNKARTSFNKEFSQSFELIIDMLNKKLFRKWQ